MSWYCFNTSIRHRLGWLL